MVLHGDPGGAEGDADVGDSEVFGHDGLEGVNVGLERRVGEGQLLGGRELGAHVARQVLLAAHDVAFGGVEHELAERGASFSGVCGCE